MTAADGQIKGSHRPASKGGPDVLRAKDIIPGTRGEDESAPDKSGDIPQFDLASDIMAEQRRRSAERRKRPGSMVNTQSVSEGRRAPDIERRQTPDPVVADIVARDIERLCCGLLV